MVQRFPKKPFCALLLASTLCLAVPAVQAKQPRQAQQQPQQSQQSQHAMTAAQATAKAKARHGGTVLKVTPKGQGFRVKLLTDSGRVMTVTVKD
ncbi:MAG: starvation-inducible outer membrane lipoprotein [Halioglobus sp.]|jgi:starvation-inducible outer membrane lipoprotein